MQEMGHTDPGLALKVYAQAMRRDETEQRQLRELVEGPQKAFIGIRGENQTAEDANTEAA